MPDKTPDPPLDDGRARQLLALLRETNPLLAALARQADLRSKEETADLERMWTR